MNFDIKEAIERRWGSGVKRPLPVMESTEKVIRVPKTREGEACVINGVRYPSLTNASRQLSITEPGLTPSEVRRRCYSRRVRYQHWRMEGVEKTPILRVSIDGVLFESTAHAHRHLPHIPKPLIENRCLSGASKYRHWCKLETPITDMSYEEMDRRIAEMKSVRERITTISCEGREFYTIAEAAEHFGLSPERIRQKLESDRYPDYQYLRD